MNEDIKAQWVAALRSGDYPQGKHRLRRIDDTYCCLGVLCDLAVKAGVITEPELEAGKDAYAYGNDGSRSRISLTWDVESWSGLHDDFFVAKLMGMNDSGKFTFSDIADVIEQQL